MPCAAPVTTTTWPVKSKRVVLMRSGSGAVEPDADALRVELEVEGEQLADALVGQRDAVRAQALQVDRLEPAASAPACRSGALASERASGDHLVELGEEQGGEARHVARPRP